MLPQSQEYELGQEESHVENIYTEYEDQEHDPLQSKQKPIQLLPFFAPHEQPEIKLEEDVNPQKNVCHLNSSSDECSPPTQSRLHNCPKHLIKILAEALQLRRLQTKQYKTELPTMKEDELMAFKSLLELVYLSHKRKLKSVSKQLLKVVFETGSQKMSRLRLLHNPIVRNCFRNIDEQAIDRAKQILRQFTFERLAARKNELVQRSRLMHKGLIMRYVELFMKELKEGTIRERMSKSDTLKLTNGSSSEDLR